MERAVLSIGSNLGDRRENLSRAVEMLGEAGEVLRCSSILESEPWGDVAGEDGCVAAPFLNMAVELLTALEPVALLAVLKEIERRLGRVPVTGPVAVAGADPGSGPHGQDGSRPGAEEMPGIAPPGGRKYLSRTIDIDIIYYGEVVLETPVLRIPHPLVAERLFVLEPLAEILPGWRHPVTGLTPGEMIGLLAESTGE